MGKLDQSPLAIKMLISVLPLTTFGFVISLLLVSLLPNGLVVTNNTNQLGQYTSSPPPGSSPPPSYSSSPGYTAPPPAQPSSSPPPPSQPPSGGSYTPPPSSQPSSSTPPPSSPPPSSQTSSPPQSQPSPPPASPTQNSTSQPSSGTPPPPSQPPSSASPPPSNSGSNTQPSSPSPSQQTPPSSSGDHGGYTAPQPNQSGQTQQPYPGQPNSQTPNYNGPSTPPPAQPGQPSQPSYPPQPNGTPPQNAPSPNGYPNPGNYPSQQPGGSTNPSNPNQPPAAPAPPPVLTVNDPASCIAGVLGDDAANKFRSGSFVPSGDQISKVNSAGCFAAAVSAGPPLATPQGGPGGPAAPGPGGFNGPNFPTAPNIQGGFNANQPPVLAAIPIAPPPQFQQDSPAITCAKQILGADKFAAGTPPSPDQMSQLQSKCFAPVATASQIGFVGANGQTLPILPPTPGGPATPNNPQGPPPALPPEVKACVNKAGITDTQIAAIQSGQAPTAQQQQAGEGCFAKYAQDKGYTLPTLVPPDPGKAFDPHAKQNECAALVAQTHGISVSQISPAVVESWNTDDIGRLRSCYGVATSDSARSNSMVFAPTTPQVAISSTKLDCIKQAVGADKLAAVTAGTAIISDSDRSTVYNKCINPTKIVTNADPVLQGILSALPVSDLESQFVPVNAKELPAPSAANATNQNASEQIAISGEINVPTGTTLPTKVDVYVKSTPQIFTVALSKINDTKAAWTVKIAHNKLPLGNHKAYALATLADATQIRSPEANFSVATAKAAGKTNSAATTIIIVIVALAALGGAWYAWRWHNKHQGSKPPENMPKV